MNEDTESELRTALRPVAPSDEFTQRLVAQLVAQPHSQAKVRHGSWRLPNRSKWWLSAAVAASMLLAVAVQKHLQEVRARESGLEAHREVVEALRMTSQKLNLAYETVRSQATSLADVPGV